MNYKKVDFMPRFLAALIDGVIGWVPVFIPVIGALIGAAYLLLKDGVMYQFTKDDEWKNRSIGKKIMKLEVVKLDEGYVDLAVSAKRNIPLIIGSIIAIIPLLGWVLGPIISIAFIIIELIAYLSDDTGRRLGDRWANTQVIQVEQAEQYDEDISEEL
ncbi:MAG: RDD family protein [bacterium]